MSVLCAAGQTFTFSMRVEDQAEAGSWKAAPTIAVGDFQISVNGGAYSNLDNLPTVTPVGSVRIEVVLSAAETAAATGGMIDVDAIDQAGDEWHDASAQIRVGAGPEISDEVLKRGTSNVEGTADTSSLAAQVMATFNSGISGAVWTIRKSDGTTFAVKGLTLDPSGKPVIDVT